MAVTVSPPEVRKKYAGLVSIQNTDTTTAAKHLFVPEDNVWELQSLSFKLVTSVDVANRQVTFRILDELRVVQFTMNAAAVQVASATEYYNAIMGGDTPLETVATFHFLPMPNPTLLLPGWELEVYESSGSDDGTQSVAALIIAEPVTAGDTFTINGVVFTLVAALTVPGSNEILIGANEAATKTALNAAFGDTPSGENVLHNVTPFVRESLLATAVDFSTDDMVFTAVHAGSAYDSIDTTETFTHVSNIFSGAVFSSGVNSDDAGSLTVIVNEYDV